jgi:hypothetical protein
LAGVKKLKANMLKLVEFRTTSAHTIGRLIVSRDAFTGPAFLFHHGKKTRRSSANSHDHHVNGRGVQRRASTGRQAIAFRARYEE